ncbi:MAG: lytic transglycosylase domain-containing protein [Solirubrobacteraceae bacterium]
MSVPSATATRPHGERRSTLTRRRAARRRRLRSLLVIAAAALAVVAAVLILPLARRAVNDLSLPLRYQDAIRHQAAAKHLDPALIAGVIYAETKFDPRPSSAGAEGPMQILPATAEYLAHRSGATTFRVSDLNTPQINIAYGSYYLRYLLNEYHGSVVLALAAYNGGEANVDSWVAAVRARGDRFVISDIPFPETRAYVQRVLKARADYRRTYASELGYR